MTPALTSLLNRLAELDKAQSPDVDVEARGKFITTCFDVTDVVQHFQSMWADYGFQTACDYLRSEDALARNALPLLLEIIRVQQEALNDVNEFTSAVLEDMQHYFENKCVPTAEEVNQCAIADSHLRLAVARVEALAAEKEGKG